MISLISKRYGHDILTEPIVHTEGFTIMLFCETTYHIMTICVPVCNYIKVVCMCVQICTLIYRKMFLLIVGQSSKGAYVTQCCFKK